MDLEVLGGVQKCSGCGDGSARKDHGCAVYVLLDVLMEHRVVEAAAAAAMETVRPLGFKTTIQSMWQQIKQQWRRRWWLSGPGLKETKTEDQT